MYLVWFTIVIILSNQTLLRDVRSASPMIVRRNGIITDSSARQVWFRTARAVAKDGIAVLKDSDKHQTSLQKAKNPSQHVDLFNGREADSIFYLFGLSDDNRKKYNTVSNKSEAYFVKRRNPVYKWRSLICVDRKKNL